MAEVNGGNHAPNQPRPEEQLEALVRQTLGLIIRGLLVSTPGVPAHLALNAVCRQVGNLCAGAIQGDLSSVLQVRKGFKDAFHEGMTKAPVLPSQMPAAPGAQANG